MAEALIWFLRLIDKIDKWWMADNAGNCFWHNVVIIIIMAVCTFAVVMERRKQNG